MTRLRVVIVDDEELARSLVREHLAAHPDVQVVSECANGLEAIEAVAAHAPDLLFLDVQMPRLTGFETLELLEPRPAVVFVTAYDRHAVKAFEVNAVDYLLKPFSKERFDAALAKARALLAAGARGPEPAALAAAARPEGAPLERIAVREGTRVTLLPVDTVEWAKAEDDYVLIRSGGRNHLKHQTLADLAAQLPATRFVRVHRSWVLNVGRLSSLEEGKTAVMADGERVPVSRSGAARLKEILRTG
ncbi:MAG TPA: response regulator [Thermoanaerobaculia bacterium]|nr:response regulator [Thermoanaerobaculia bacterium]